MAKYKQKVSEETIDESMKIAKATQKPGQSKQQTRLIAQGIQKGIEQFKKQQKTKSRELDKKLRQVKASSAKASSDNLENNHAESERLSVTKSSKLPWGLLVLSWLLFSAYFFIFDGKF